jgi:hypothetical protein
MKRKPWTIEGLDVVDKDSGKVLAKLGVGFGTEPIVTASPIVRVTTHDSDGRRVTYFLRRPFPVIEKA